MEYVELPMFVSVGWCVCVLVLCDAVVGMLGSL